MNGHRAAAAYPRGGPPRPLADYPPGAGYEQGTGQPSGAGSGPADYPDYPAATGYPDPPGYQQDGYDPAGYPPMPDYPPAPDYPPMPDYPPGPGYRPGPGYPPPPGYPATGYAPGGYPPGEYAAADQLPGGYPVAEFPAADGSWVLDSAAVTHEEYVHPRGMPVSAVGALRARAARAGMRMAGPARASEAPASAAPVSSAPAAGSNGAQQAMLAYLTVPFLGFLVPLAIYLASMRGSGWVRAHAAQALNVWLTVLLYDLSALIIGGVLVLDSPGVALAVEVPLLTVLWLTALAFLVRAAVRASRGEAYTLPRWLCTPIVR